MKLPAPLSQSELEQVLKEILDGVVSGDTMEGSIEFLIPGPCPDHEGNDNPDCKWCQSDTLAVTGMWRVGNLMGQGGYASIGEFVDAPEPEDPLRDAAEALLALKDGPRDDAYRAAKDGAWEALRAALR